MKQLIFAVMGMVAVSMLAIGPADAQWRSDRQGQKVPVAGGTCRPESYDACVARQLKLRDPVSGIRIQPGDAGRFCNRKSQRC